MTRVACAVALLVTLACTSRDPGAQSTKPTGTPTDPVEVCERLADVCRLDGAKLGVCTAPGPGPAPAACNGREPCYLCTSQH